MRIHKREEILFNNIELVQTSDDSRTFGPFHDDAIFFKRTDKYRHRYDRPHNMDYTLTANHAYRWTRYTTHDCHWKVMPKKLALILALIAFPHPVPLKKENDLLI